MLTSKRAKFTLPPQVTYLNCAYMSPLMKEVEQEGIRAVRRKRNPVGITPQDFFTTSEALRREFAQLVHAEDPQRVAIIPSVSYGLATVARNLNIRKGQHIIVAAEQFPSNVYPWQSVCEETGATIKTIAPPETTSGRGKEWNGRILDAITSDTRAVAIGHVHWADGTRFDLAAIRKRTREVGALLIIDGTQSVGAMPFDVATLQPDALICAGYKWLMGPYSIGLAYYGPYFDSGKPIEENWINRLNSENFAGLVNYQSQYQPGALRYEVGEHSNFILVPMMLAALRQLNKWGPANIQEYCKHISNDAIPALRDMGFSIEDDAWRGSHLVGLRLPPHLNLDALKAAFTKYKVYVSFRGNAIRIAPNVYNTPADFGRLLKAIRKA